MLTEIIDEKGNVELSAYYVDYDQFKERVSLFESLGYKVKTTISMLTKIATANLIKCKNTIDIREYNEKKNLKNENLNDNKSKKIARIIRVPKNKKMSITFKMLL
jgi:hypothetical protein